MFYFLPYIFRQCKKNTDNEKKNIIAGKDKKLIYTIGEDFNLSLLLKFYIKISLARTRSSVVKMVECLSEPIYRWIDWL